MALQQNMITRENDYFHAVSLARQLTNRDKVEICPHFSFVFYADLEIYLNSYIHHPDDRWYLIFDDLSQVNRQPNSSNGSKNESNFSTKFFPTHFDIYHNTKLKYHCDRCGKDWTTMQGQISFRIQLPVLDPPFVLFVDIGRQQCQRCYSLIEASCYLEEVTRIMKLTSRSILETFHSIQNFQPEDLVEETIQRPSRTQGHHQRHLCFPCQQGLCWQHRRRKRQT